MEIWEGFTKRQQKAEQAKKLDVYRYDEIPLKFRNQVIHLWMAAIGQFVRMPADPWPGTTEPASNAIWRIIFFTVTRELGVFGFGESNKKMDLQCIEYFQKASTNEAVDLIELSFQVIDVKVRGWNAYVREQVGVSQSVDSAIDELNYRFKDHRLGYQFENGRLIRLDSDYVHTEMVKPALALLQIEEFRGASDEFLRAHAHYRKGLNKEALNEAGKAFESTLKTICSRRKWAYSERDTAKTLIKTVLDNGLLPSYSETHLHSLRTIMESGLPTVRNKQGAHGQGEEPMAVSDYSVSYALHLAAANIVFLIEAYGALKN